MGALTRDELQVAIDAEADVVAWSERSPRRQRACT